MSCPEYATNRLTMRHAACYRMTQGKAGPMGRGDRAPRSRPSLSPGMPRACPSAGKVAGNSCVTRTLTKKGPEEHGLVTAIHVTKCFSQNPHKIFPRSLLTSTFFIKTSRHSKSVSPIQRVVSGCSRNRHYRRNIAPHLCGTAFWYGSCGG